MSNPAQALGLEPEPGEHGPPQSTRWGGPLSGPARTALTVVGALLVGFLITGGVTSGREVAEAQDARRADLVALIQDRHERVTALEAQLEDLRERLGAAEAAAAAPSLQRALGEVEGAAGLTPVRGPGMQVTFDDAGSSCRGTQPQDCRIQDADLQLAVNALFAAGAEAVSVNGERVIATTAVRGAGRAILVNYRVLSPPFVVEAIGDPERLPERFEASQIADDFSVWRDTYGLGFSVTSVADLTVPAYSGGVRLRSAQVTQASGGDA